MASFQYDIGMFLIDGQECFNRQDMPLRIKNGDKQMAHFAQSCDSHLGQIDLLAETEDSHQKWHIAHSIFWKDRNNKHPDPFTTILASDVRNGLWIPQVPIKGITEYCIWYCDQLENPTAGNRRFELTIWPDHGIVGAYDWCLDPSIQKLNDAWESSNFRRIKHHTKGNSVLTEHFSGLRAEVVLDGKNPLGVKDESTYLNIEIPSMLKQCRKVGVAGQAISHCVRFTLEDLVEIFGAQSIERIFVLIDCCGPVDGYEQKTDEWLHSMQNKINIVTIDKFWKA